jgi:hypothetical protein
MKGVNQMLFNMHSNKTGLFFYFTKRAFFIVFSFFYFSLWQVPVSFALNHKIVTIPIFNQPARSIYAFIGAEIVNKLFL